jgi:hypothetical protein
MKKEFALDPGGPKRLTITYPGNLANAEVLLDGQRVMAFSSKAEFQRGTTCKLADGSMLTVRFGPIEGVPLLKGVHVIRLRREQVWCWRWAVSLYSQLSRNSRLSLAVRRCTSTRAQSQRIRRRAKRQTSSLAWKPSAYHPLHQSQ